MARQRYEFLPDLLPLVVMINTEGLEIEDINGVFGYYDAVVDKNAKFVSVTDARTIRTMPTASTRRALGEAAKKFEQRAAGLALGSGMVIDSILVRGALTAVEWISQTKNPTVYFATMPEAIDWAIARIEAAGLTITPKIRAYRQSLEGPGSSRRP